MARNVKNRVSTSSLSGSVRDASSRQDSKGKKVLTAGKIRVAKEREAGRQAERLAGRIGWFSLLCVLIHGILLAMNRAERRNIEQLQDHDLGSSFDDGNDTYEQDVLHGRMAAEISHAGDALPLDYIDASDANLLAGLSQNRRCVVFLIPILCS